MADRRPRGGGGCVRIVQILTFSNGVPLCLLASRFKGGSHHHRARYLERALCSRLRQWGAAGLSVCASDGFLDVLL